MEVRRPRREHRVVGVVCLNCVNSLIRPDQFFYVLSLLFRCHSNVLLSIGTGGAGGGWEIYSFPL